MLSKQTTLTLQSLQKTYGANRALCPITHTLSGSRIHALIGKNGSGKSTLIKIIAGATQATSGEVLLNGEPMCFNSPQDALDAGIVTVHQELSLIPELTVAENIFLGRMPKSHGFIHWSTLNKKARDLLDTMGAKEISVTDTVGSLSVGKQQVVEIAKAMSFAPRVLQLDEPTSALAQEEVEHLFALLRRLRDSGVLLIYVSHRLSELAEIADDVLVLRDGEFIGAVDIETATPKKIVDMMFGQVDEFLRRDKHATSTEVVLEVQDLSIAGVLDQVSFKLHKGEVLGIAGMLGSGRTELLRGVFGADPIDSGRIFVGGKHVKNPTPQGMRDLGVGYTSEDRKIKGLVQSLSCHANLCLAGLRRMARYGWISARSESPFVKKQIEDLRIKLGDPMHLVSSLSGGNQQKIVVGNWLNIEPRVMMFDEPSRGVDVQAKQQIFKMMWELSKTGLAAIVVSTELEELPTVCDRILVLKKGRFTQELSPDIGAKALYEACMVEQADK
jgi:ribose transport system ATP-binding protein